MLFGLKKVVLIFPVNMPYELLKIAPYSSNGNIGWEDAENVSAFMATRRSLRRQFARELKMRGVDVSGGAYKFESYGRNDENIELVDVETGEPLWAAVCAC